MTISTGHCVPDTLRLRPAQASDADELTHLARTAKAHWGYDQALLDSWASVLSFSPEYIRDHWVVVAQAPHGESGDAPIVGVCALGPVGDVLEIDGMWVLPEGMGKGVGRVLVEAALAHCRSEQVTTLRLLSDPHAQGFYQKLGARLIGHERDTPEGRLLPLMHFDECSD